ncbi:MULTISPECIES: hypothetical protein [Halobacteriovorax]|uniref:Yip1 domain-containing protein n=1 Tax=Halobacteriovorax vibrionivorans TaxID=2152716 RepID=A0ABY0IKB7_9BACT|nr:MULTISPECIES: hypothetical protein [Halobacteriovorax]AYF43680.1 hypothetical protein BALOs_0669 [Halobacteriovorax sp. BALOs_7]RZF21757.1 hypothetical protein DAY19_08695 [Halobacteriovorax vibrionivorans]TGD45864.1 hypothetical protein EP118_14315 [Halobacteriovorax sp. Y22]
MISIYQQYIKYLLYPKLVNSNIASHREELEKIREARLFEIVKDESRRGVQLKFTDFTLASWPFVLIYGLYSLVQIHIGILLSAQMAKEGFLPAIFSSSEFQQKAFLFSTLFKVVFFPLSAWVFVKFWRVVISLFAGLFDKDLEGVNLEDTIAASLVGNFFLIIPIFGDFLKFVSQVVYLYFGLRYNLRFSFVQSFFILLSPLILIVGLFLVMLMYISLIISFI